MTMLPDIDEQGWNDWHNQQFDDEVQRKIHGLALDQTVADRGLDLARIGAWAAAPAPTLPEPPPVAEPAPTLPEPPPPVVAEPAPAATVESAPPAAAAPSPPVARGAAFSPSSAPQPSPAPAPDAEDWGITAFNAATSAGANAGQFLTALQQGTGDRMLDAANAVLRAGGDLDQFVRGLGGPSAPVPPASPTPQPATGGSLQDYARQAAQRAGVDPEIFTRQIQQESGFNPNARSPAGAQGVAQIVPKFHPGVDPSDPYASLDYAANLMKSNLGKYGGDYRKALAAYNAGGGAVDRYGDVPPFEETQRYVNTILGGQQVSRSLTPAEGVTRAGAALGAANRDISQFGDSQLTNDEAYAACGPAAAVRFAQRFGRNPTLREATDLAKTVGWTSAQGMAGLSSEKALMDKLGVATKLVSGADWGTFANEARTGNPVTISTAGHYFTADGWDPQTNRFHVGRSGLDLKGGSEWMTPEQMTAIMGPVQGGLLADNPQVASPSIADQDTNPVGWLDRTRQAMADSLAPPGPPKRTELEGSALRPELSSVFSWTPGEPTQQVASVDQARPLAEVAGVQQPAAPEPESSNPIDRLKSAFSDFVDSIGGSRGDQPVNAPGAGYDPSALRAITEPSQEGLPLKQDVRDLAGVTQPTIFDELGPRLSPDYTPPGGVGPSGEPALETPETPGVLPRILRGPLLTTDQEVLSRATAEDLDMARQYARLTHPNDPTFEPDQAELANVLRSMKVGEAYASTHTGYGGGAVRPPRPTRGWNPQASADPANRAIGDMLGAEPVGPDLGSFWQQFVRKATNRFEAADRFQEDTLRAAGGHNLANPPEELDLIAKLREINGDSAGQIRVDRDLKPAIRAAGDDVDALQTYLIHKNNLDVAAEIARRVEQDAINAGRSPAQAAQEAAQAYTDRTFSGGLHVDDSMQGLQVLEQELGPQRWQHVENTAARVYDYVDSLRQRMLESGLIDQETYTTWQRDMPNWVPTRILDYLDEGASGNLKVGTKISLADNGVRQYTTEGTARFRESPLGALMDLAHGVETRARRNEAANALVNLDQLLPQDQQRLVRTDRPSTANEPIVQRINNGTVERYLGTPELAAAVNGPNIEQAPGFVRNWTNFVRNVTTVMSPAFALVRNPSLDVPEYYMRELSRAGGNPLALPRITARLFQGYMDAAQGMRQGEFRGPMTQRYLLGGGGGAGMVERTVADRQAAIDALTGRGREINSLQDLVGVARDIATLEPLKAAGRGIANIAERTELGPRVASMRLAEEAGMTPSRAVLNGRRVTMDFNEGGTLAKAINSFVPFFNVGVQGSAQMARMARENPVGFVSSMGMTVGLPTIMAEAWNRSDAQRSADYDDVPDYLKDLGVVFMLPGEAPVDKDGNRRPQFYWFNMRGAAPLMQAARQATAEGLQRSGNERAKPQDYQELLSSIFTSSLPLRASSLGDVPGSLMPEIFPGVSTGTQLAMNKDIFRGRDIVTQRTNEEAPQAAREIADAMTNMARQIDPKFKVEPAQVDFAVRDMLGGVGSTALGAREILPGAEPQQGNEPQRLPLVGGVVKAVGFRGDIGETLRKEREQVLTPSAQKYLQSQGVEYVPDPVEGKIGDLPLKYAEQVMFQKRANKYIDDALHEMERDGELSGEELPTRIKMVQARISGARQQAAADVMDTIPDAEFDTRIEREREKALMGKR